MLTFMHVQKYVEIWLYDIELQEHVFMTELES